MKMPTEKIVAVAIVFAGLLGTSAYAEDATSKLFELMDSGDCVPESLTGETWSITAVNGQTHGELVVGDTLEFIQQQAASGVSAATNFIIERNSIDWISENGWVGQCVSDGSTSRYVVDGQVDVDGCTHEFAFTRTVSSQPGIEEIQFVMSENGCVMRAPGDADGGANNQ